jgi:hypothetical protein
LQHLETETGRWHNHGPLVRRSGRQDVKDPIQAEAGQDFLTQLDMTQVHWVKRTAE